MKKTGRISSGCLPWLVVIIVIGVFAQVSINNYVQREKDADKKQLNSIVSGKLPDSLQCLSEIKIVNRELSISLHNKHFKYDQKISENQLIHTDFKLPMLIYSNGTYANGESHYKESLSLIGFDGKTAKFLASVTYDGDRTPEGHKIEFDVTGSFSRITQKE